MVDANSHRHCNSYKEGGSDAKRSDRQPMNPNSIYITLILVLMCIGLIMLSYTKPAIANGFIPQNLACSPCMTIKQFRAEYPDIKWPHDIKAVMGCWK